MITCNLTQNTGFGLHPSRGPYRAFCSRSTMAVHVRHLFHSHTCCTRRHLGNLMPHHEYLYIASGHESRECCFDVSSIVSGHYFLFPFTNTSLRTASGLLMAFIGVVYLAFEDFVLSDFTSSGTKGPSHRVSILERSLTGVQVQYSISLYPGTHLLTLV